VVEARKINDELTKTLNQKESEKTELNKQLSELKEKNTELASKNESNQEKTKEMNEKLEEKIKEIEQWEKIAESYYATVKAEKKEFESQVKAKDEIITDKAERLER
jgi:TolA-binding protein